MSKWIIQLNEGEHSWSSYKLYIWHESVVTIFNSIVHIQMSSVSLNVACCCIYQFVFNSTCDAQSCSRKIRSPWWCPLCCYEPEAILAWIALSQVADGQSGASSLCCLLSVSLKNTTCKLWVLTKVLRPWGILPSMTTCESDQCLDVTSEEWLLYVEEMLIDDPFKAQMSLLV